VEDAAYFARTFGCGPWVLGFGNSKGFLFESHAASPQQQTIACAHPYGAVSVAEYRSPQALFGVNDSRENPLICASPQ
jgi:hypothetical protein